MNRTDSELVALVASGSDSAYAELYRRYRPVAQRCARRLAPRDVDADDLVSDSFITVLRAIQHGHLPRRFRPYLCKTISRHAHKLYERRARIHTVSLDCDHHQSRVATEVPDFDADPAAASDTEFIRRAFRSLPPRWRAALWLSAVEGRTPAEFAPVFDLTPQAAAALTCRARHGLARAHDMITAATPPLRTTTPCTESVVGQLTPTVKGIA